MSMAVPASSRWWVAGVIARREATAAMRGIGIYVALALALVAAKLFIVLFMVCVF